MASQWQIKANQRSAQRSTGPRSEEGKRAARANALRFGLTSEGIVLPAEMVDEVNRRYSEFQCVLRPFDTYDNWLCEVATVTSVQIDVCQRHLIVLAQEQADRAANRWQADRMLEADRIAERLPRSPSRVARELKGFKQGAEWMILRWEGLADVVEATGEVEDAQRQTALDLLGWPLDVRRAATPLDLADRSPAAALAGVARREIAALEVEIAEDLARRDEDDRSRTELGFGTPTHEMTLIRRYLAAAKSRHAWAKATMNKGGRNDRPALPPEYRPEPAWKPFAEREQPEWAPLPPDLARGDVSLPTVVPLASSLPQVAAAGTDPEPDPSPAPEPEPAAPDPAPHVATDPDPDPIEPPDPDPRR